MLDPMDWYILRPHFPGLFNPSHMAFETDDENRTQPNLVEMTKKAIEILQKDKKGYFLLVEG